MKHDLCYDIVSFYTVVHHIAATQAVLEILKTSQLIRHRCYKSRAKYVLASNETVHFHISFAPSDLLRSQCLENKHIGKVSS